MVSGLGAVSNVRMMQSQSAHLPPYSPSNALGALVGFHLHSDRCLLRSVPTELGWVWPVFRSTPSPSNVLSAWLGTIFKPNGALTAHVLGAWLDSIYSPTDALPDQCPRILAGYNLHTDRRPPRSPLAELWLRIRRVSVLVQHDLGAVLISL